MSFEVASKDMAKIKVAMTGPAGAGKTLSALKFAKGLTKNGRVGVVDSENGSASLYADQFPGWKYFVKKIEPPYTARKYLDALVEAEQAGMEALIIDSYTHVWAGEGGLLQQKEALDRRAGSNSFTNWAQITRVHEQLKGKILHSNMHIVATMRSKQEYILETNERGKQAPKKVGLKPIQREDMEYEFTLCFDIGMDHQYIVSKDRTNLFDGTVAMVDEKTGRAVADWLTQPMAEEMAPDMESPLAIEVPPFSEPVPAPIVNVAMGTGGYGAGGTGKVVVEEVIAPPQPPKVYAPPSTHEKPPVREIRNHADNTMRQMPMKDSANYVIKCGANWGMVGKKISDINESTLKAALNQAKGIVAQRGAAVDPNVWEFVKNATEFLTSVGVAI